MSSQEPQGWNRESPDGRPVPSEVPHVRAGDESGPRAAHRIDWAASFHCGRCRGLMYRIELRDWGGSRGQDGCHALQCIACGDIIDPVIVKNRWRARRPRMELRKAREGRRHVAMVL